MSYTNRTVPRLMMRVWDAPTRLFHWAIVVLIAVSYVSVRNSWMQIHFLSGYTVLTLLLFRLVWGFIGSETSRFRKFLRSPVAGFQHLATFAGKREPDTEIGHNAAGGWMVLLMLGVLAAHVATGLFSNDDIDAQGPLAGWVSKDMSNYLTSWHYFSFKVLLGLIALHILAVLAYAAVKRHDLVRPMITGKKRLPGNLRQPRFASPFLALALLAASAGLVWAFVRWA